MASKRGSGGKKPAGDATESKAGVASVSSASSRSTASGTLAIANYGLDSPSEIKSLYSRAAWTFAFGFALWFMNRTEYPGPGLKMFAALALVAAVFVWVGWFMTWSSRTGKLKLRDQLVSMLALNGDEKVLDAGCGLGLLSIGIAKRLKTGKVTAVDVWNPQVLSGNSADLAQANAKAEAVADRIRFEDGDVRHFGYPAANFDVAVSCGILHFFDEETERDQAVRELYRVVKPGGKLLIFDVSFVSRYAEILRESGATDVNITSIGFLWCRFTKAVTARK
jgi:SAM-dependent methyltransferase